MFWLRVKRYAAFVLPRLNRILWYVGDTHKAHPHLALDNVKLHCELLCIYSKLLLKKISLLSDQQVPTKIFSFQVLHFLHYTIK